MFCYFYHLTFVGITVSTSIAMSIVRVCARACVCVLCLSYQSPEPSASYNNANIITTSVWFPLLTSVRVQQQQQQQQRVGLVGWVGGWGSWVARWVSDNRQLLQKHASVGSQFKVRELIIRSALRKRCIWVLTILLTDCVLVDTKFWKRLCLSWAKSLQLSLCPGRESSLRFGYDILVSFLSFPSLFIVFFDYFALNFVKRERSSQSATPNPSAIRTLTSSAVQTFAFSVRFANLKRFIFKQFQLKIVSIEFLWTSLVIERSSFCFAFVVLDGILNALPKKRKFPCLRLNSADDRSWNAKRLLKIENSVDLCSAIPSSSFFPPLTVALLTVP